MTLNEYKRHLDSFDNYLMVIKNATSNELYALILDVQSDNVRYTEVTIGTDTDDAVNGSISIQQPGQYRYTVYGQNSTTNLDPEDATVVGVVEKGVLWVKGTDTYYDADEPTVPAFKIHRES